MPSPVDKYFKEVKDSNPSYSDEQAWATAWSIYCKHKNPGSDHCKKPAGEYLKGKSAQEMAFIARVASRHVEAESRKLRLGPAIQDQKATSSLQQIKKLALRNTGGLNSAIISAAGYAKKLGHTMYVYSGNSYMSPVWRVSYKPSEYLNPISNTGTKIASVTADLVLSWHEVTRPE